MEKQVGSWSVDAEVSVRAYPLTSHHKPVRGDVVYDAAVTIGSDDGETNVEVSITSDSLAGLRSKARKLCPIALRDCDEQEDAIDIEAAVVAAIDHFVLITGDARAARLTPEARR